MDKRKRKHQNLYRRPDQPGGTWWIDYHRNGRRIRESLETDVLKTAKERRDAILQGEANRKWGKSDQDVSPVDFWSKYSEWAVSPHGGQKSRNTVQREAICWQHFIGFLNPETLGGVTQDDAKAFRKYLQSAKKQSPRTINDTVTRLHGLYEHAKKIEVYGRGNPFAGLDRLHVDDAPVRFLSPEQIDAVLWAACVHSRDTYLFCSLCLYAGLRMSEAVYLRWENIDFDNGFLTIQADVQSGFRPKGKRHRTIPINARLRAILTHFRALKGFVLLPDKSEPGKWRIRYEPKRGFNSVAAAAGVPWCTPHVLRHTFASRLVQEGVELFKVQSWLGHRDPRTTMIYSHLRKRDSDIDRI